MAYTLYGAVRSRALRVRWMLEELGVDYTHVPAGPRSEDVRKVSPLGKIPVLLDGEAVVRDSTAILTYLADKHGQFTAQAGTLPRAQQDAWTFRVLDEIEGPLWTASRHSHILPEEERVSDIVAACHADYARSLDGILSEMSGPYLAGEDMTVPDIILAHCGGWAKSAGFPEAGPKFATYLEEMRSRPAFKAALR